MKTKSKIKSICDEFNNSTSIAQDVLVFGMITRELFENIKDKVKNLINK